MFNSPNKYSFKVYLPDFLPTEIKNVFDAYIFNEQTLVYNNTKDLFDSQIKGFEIPDLGLQTVDQTVANGVISQLEGKSTFDKYGDKRVEVTIKAISGYLNYNIARYAYLIYSNAKLSETSTGILDDLRVIFNDADALFKYELLYKNVVWLGVTVKTFSYDQTTQQTDDFVLAFEHNGFEVRPIINDKIAASKGLSIVIE